MANYSKRAHQANEFDVQAESFQVVAGAFAPPTPYDEFGLGFNAYLKTALDKRIAAYEDAHSSLYKKAQSYLTRWYRPLDQKAQVLKQEIAELVILREIHAYYPTILKTHSQFIAAYKQFEQNPTPQNKQATVLAFQALNTAIFPVSDFIFDFKPADTHKKGSLHQEQDDMHNAVKKVKNTIPAGLTPDQAQAHQDLLEQLLRARSVRDASTLLVLGRSMQIDLLLQERLKSSSPNTPEYQLRQSMLEDIKAAIRPQKSQEVNHRIALALKLVEFGDVRELNLGDQKGKVIFDLTHLTKTSELVKQVAYCFKIGVVPELTPKQKSLLPSKWLAKHLKIEVDLGPDKNVQQHLRAALKVAGRGIQPTFTSAMQHRIKQTIQSGKLKEIPLDKESDMLRLSRKIDFCFKLGVKVRVTPEQIQDLKRWRNQTRVSPWVLHGYDFNVVRANKELANALGGKFKITPQGLQAYGKGQKQFQEELEAQSRTEDQTLSSAEENEIPAFREPSTGTVFRTASARSENATESLSIPPPSRPGKLILGRHSSRLTNKTPEPGWFDVEGRQVLIYPVRPVAPPHLRREFQGAPSIPPERPTHWPSKKVSNTTSFKSKRNVSVHKTALMPPPPPPRSPPSKP